MAPALGTIVVVRRLRGCAPRSMQVWRRPGLGSQEVLGIAAGTLKNGPDVYCVDDSEIVRERQCMSQLRGLDELVGLVGV